MSNQKIFTYLLGAGASAKSLPIVKDFSKAVVDACSSLTAYDYYNRLRPDEQDIISQIKQEIILLALESDEYSSVDTYAKSLYLKNDFHNLKKLKTALSLFFTIEQCLKKVDKRYDSFYASLLTRNNDTKELNSMPANIKVLSWNYDYQMELSFSKFQNAPSPERIEKFLNIIPRKDSQPATGFELFKLNGTACGFQMGDIFERDILLTKYIPYSNSLTEESYMQLVRSIINYYKEYNRRTQASIHFAWENDPIPQNTRRSALESTKSTNILVVIGYSFPVFNRDIDRELINNMSNLEKIYIQIPENDIESVIERFRAVYDYSLLEEQKKKQGIRFLERITNKDEFIIPYEYDNKYSNPNQLTIEAW